MEPTPEFVEEEVRGALEVTSSTGKFWLDWDKLKNMLSFQLKQVLLEYPESKMATEQQNASLGETFPHLVKRLDEELRAFIQGPPFTLQRICEILLAARSIYPNLSKLALALEKNLLVTSTITVCTDAYPQTTMPNSNEQDKASEEPPPPTLSNSMPNGVEATGDRDEVMTEVEEANINHNISTDMDSFQEMVGPSETNAAPTENS
ncbi:hypothetical protein SLEP1_g30491 [Rubroshorea leprosula]|uniref:Serine/threonine-protein phosphatase 4 regulatory subunit 2 n=1 Tax=Rubroshorea leprosula TaxID=152421 RepID=A0AAV5K608_9ROSI|nr:hypothetical protein SLEP1_g30491 [Rubroshorea leprosula]